MRHFIGPMFLLLACSTVATAEGPPARTYDEINSNVTKENVEYFKAHLSKCPEDEIRCLWFHGDHMKVGMVMTLDLGKQRVFTVREVYDLASQNNENRPLSFSQVTNAKALVPNLPPGAGNVAFGKGLHISYWFEGKLHTVTYDRKAAPVIVQRLYDLGGGEIDCTYAK